MGATTGPVLAIGAVTVVTRSVLGPEPIDWRVPAATGVAALGFGMFERVAPDGAAAVAWLALVTTLLARVGGRPAPVEVLLSVGQPAPAQKNQSARVTAA